VKVATAAVATVATAAAPAKEDLPVTSTAVSAAATVAAAATATAAATAAAATAAAATAAAATAAAGAVATTTTKATEEARKPRQHTVKKANDFSVPSRDFTNQSLPGNNLIILGQGEGLVTDIPAGDGKLLTFFYSASWPERPQRRERRNGKALPKQAALNEPPLIHKTHANLY
jgi:hypothetical protein